MTIASIHQPRTDAGPTPLALLWPGEHLDPDDTIPQNRWDGTALRGAHLVHPSAETSVLTDRLSLNIWCPPAYQARLEAVLVPFADRLSAKVQAQEEGEDALQTLSEAGNEPSLIFFGGLSDTLAAHLGDQRQDPDTEGDTTPVLPRAVTALVADWTRECEALLAAARAARGHITLVPAAALLDRPAAVAQAIASRYKLPFAVDDLPQVEPDAVPKGEPPHFALMASAIAQTGPAVTDLLDQLSKASLEVPGADLRRQQTPGVMQRLLIEADALHRAERDGLRREHDRDLRRVEALAEARIQRLRHQADSARLALLERDALSVRLSEEAAQNDAAANYLKEELTRRETTYAAQSAEVNVLRAASRQLENSRKASSVKGNQLEHDVDALTRNIQMRDDRISGLASALHGYEDEALALRDEVAALRRSTSWRLTAPVRGFSMVVRKVLRRG